MRAPERAGGGSDQVRAVGYIRVSTEEQAESGAGLEAQRTAIHAEAGRRGWELTEIFEDAASGRTTVRRRGLGAALETVDSGQADVLVVAKLDRLSRSLLDFASLMERSRRRGWGLVALDLGVDTSTPSGEMLANVLAVFAQFERRLIAQRTREALAVKKAQGIRLGRPSQLPRGVAYEAARIRRDYGWSYAKIAESFNANGFPTGQGGQRWYPSTVRAVIRSRAASETPVAEA